MNGGAPKLAADIGRDELLSRLRALQPVIAREGVTRMALFGSRARGDNRRDSDIDLIIDVEEGRRFSLLDLVGVGHLIEDQIGLPANLFMRRSLDREFQSSAVREQVSVF